MEILASALVRGIITFLFSAICILLMIVILLQKGRGGGLAGAFGGAGGHSAFGAKTGDVFTYVTIVLTFLFVTVAVIGNFTFVPDNPVEEQPALVSDAGPGEETATSGGQAPLESGPTSRPGG